MKEELLAVKVANDTFNTYKKEHQCYFPDGVYPLSIKSVYSEIKYSNVNFEEINILRVTFNLHTYTEKKVKRDFSTVIKFIKGEDFGTTEYEFEFPKTNPAGVLIHQIKQKLDELIQNHYLYKYGISENNPCMEITLGESKSCTLRIPDEIMDEIMAETYISSNKLLLL